LLVIAINDPSAVQRITLLAKQLNPLLYVIVRTRYLQEVASLHKLGADEVIPEEFETSIEIFSRVLTRYLIPIDTIEELVTEIRFNNYAMFRSLSRKNVQLRDVQKEIPDVEIATLRIDESSKWIGCTLSQIDLRKRCGITVVAIRREETTIANPSTDIKLKGGDHLILLGTPEQFPEVHKFFNEER
jgi:CPA2 family monovalent cation:H+ antiporter-2